MFNITSIEDKVRIPPQKFDKALEVVTYEELRSKYEGIVDKDVGFIIAVTDIKVSPIGKMIPGDGATYHTVSFTLLTYFPEVQEVVEALEKSRARFVVWGLWLDAPRYEREKQFDPGHLAPIRDYLRAHYHLVRNFGEPDYEQVWQRNP